jgi:hypothetical protein
VINAPRLTSPAARIGGALVLLGLSLFVNGRYLARAPTVVGEEHFQLGERLYATGILSLNNSPALFRPPGYPAFVAMVLRLRDVLSPGLDSQRAAALANAALLSLGALALYLHTSRHRSVPLAFAVGALYAFHPVNRIIARVIAYSTLHIVCITIATLALSCALQQRTSRRRLIWELGAGVLWGVTTLVRPVSLILPPFVLLLARWHGGKESWRSALRFTGLFTLGMALVIAPYTFRNYRLSHRLVVVNAQEGWAFWALSATRDPQGGAAWNTIWREQGEPLFKRVSGAPGYSIEALYENVLALNDAYRAEAVRNIRRDPRGFAVNVLKNFYLFNTDSMFWFIDFLPDGWDPRRDAAFKFFSVMIFLLGLAGVVRGLRNGETHARTVAIIYAMFCVAHCIAFLMARYNYVRLPLALLAVPLVLRRRDGRA